MPLDWQRIQTKATSVRAVVTTCVSVALCVAFLMCVGSLLYCMLKPDRQPDQIILNIVNSVVVLFASVCSIAVQSYFNRNDRNPPPAGGANA